MNKILKIYTNLKNYIKKHKWKSLISITVCGYYLMKLMKVKFPKNVKISYFLLALSQNAIEEVVISQSLLLYFRGRGNQKWYKTDASILTKDRIYKLILENHNIDVSAVQDSPINS